MKTALAVFFFFIALLAVFSALRVVIGGWSSGIEMNRFAGQAVGAFLVPAFFMGLGLWCLQPRKKITPPPLPPETSQDK